MVQPMRINDTRFTRSGGPQRDLDAPVALPPSRRIQVVISHLTDVSLTQCGGGIGEFAYEIAQRNIRRLLHRDMRRIGERAISAYAACTAAAAAALRAGILQAP